MDSVMVLLDAIDVTTNSSRKRHIAGGILMSVSLLFGGLAFTILTTKVEEVQYEQT